MQVLINLFQFCNWVEFAWIENWNWVLQIALGLQPLRQFNQHLIPRLPNPAMLLKKIWDVFFCFILLVLQATTKVAINQLWNYSRETTKTLHIVRFVVSDAAQLSSNTMRFLILNWHRKYFFQWNNSRETTKTLHTAGFVFSDAAPLSSNTMRFLILNWHRKYFISF